MAYTDEITRELSRYLPELTKRPDFDAFWDDTKRVTRGNPLLPERARVDSPMPGVSVHDIRYSGFDQTRIHGWLLVPEHPVGEKYPCLIHYHGFGGNRGYPWDFAHWMTLGLAVLSVDCREQGGMTGNAAAYTGGMATNVASKGLLDKEQYYFRAVYMDCVRAIDFLETCPEIDAGRIAVEGGSQGGALGMAVAALDSRPKMALVDVPSNSDLAARVAGAHGSFSAVADYLKIRPDHTDRAMETLSYFDTMNMAEKITCPVVASVALRDNVCPAKCYFATYNRIQSPKEIFVYPFNGHEGGGSRQTGVKLSKLRAWLNPNQAITNF